MENVNSVNFVVPTSSLKNWVVHDTEYCIEVVFQFEGRGSYCEATAELLRSYWEAAGNLLGSSAMTLDPGRNFNDLGNVDCACAAVNVTSSEAALAKRS